MKRINFNQRPTSVARGSSRATCENSTKHMWRLVSTVSVPSGFSDLILLGVCCKSSVLSRAFVLRSPLELIIMSLIGWQLLPSPSLTGSHTWCPVPPWFRVVRGQPLLPIQWVESKDGAIWELIRGLGYSGSSLSSCPSLSLDNLLYGEDFPWSKHRVGVNWVQARFTGLRPDG